MLLEIVFLLLQHRIMSISISYFLSNSKFVFGLSSQVYLINLRPSSIFSWRWALSARSMIVSYYSSKLSLNICSKLNSSLFSSKSSLTIQQAWGIQDIVIVLHKCHESCGTCSGNLASHCLTCAVGLYFSGSICVAYCPFYSIPDTN